MDEFFKSTAPPKKTTEEKSSFLWVGYLFAGMFVLLVLISLFFGAMALMQRKTPLPQQQRRKLLVQ